MDLSLHFPITAGLRWPRPSRRTVVVTTLLVAYLALTVAVITRSPLLRVDTDVLHWDLHRRYPQWFTAVNAYVVLGQRGPSTLVAVPWLVWRSWRSRSVRPVVLVATALVLLNLSVGVVKIYVGRLGPLATSDAYLPFAGGDIFPSGHTANAVVLYGALAMLAHERRRLMAAAAVFLAASVGLCTLYLDTHWLTDVLGGWLAGGLVLLATPRATAWAMARVTARVTARTDRVSRPIQPWFRLLTRDQMVTYCSEVWTRCSGRWPIPPAAACSTSSSRRTGRRWERWRRGSTSPASGSASTSSCSRRRGSSSPSGAVARSCIS